MREPPRIPEEHLRACLRDQYDLSPTTLEFLPLGYAPQGGVYRVVSAQGAPYLLKVRSGAFNITGSLIARYLRDQGIDAVIAPLPTTHSSLWAAVGESGEWTATMFPFIEGITGWNPVMTDAHWKATGAVLRQIHQSTLPSEGFASLRPERFDLTEYRRWIHAFETQHAGVDATARGHEQMLYALWRAHQPTIHAMLSVMETLGRALREHSEPYVICHADLHPGNVVRDDAGRVFVVDWDDVMLAPKERDFLFVKEPAQHRADEDIAPFFQGYGRVDIDWSALTYYRCERVVQDLIECAREVFFRNDLGKDLKDDAVQLFASIFAPGNEVDAARAAAAHLPPPLSFRDDIIP